jgi:hypothetical protein
MESFDQSFIHHESMMAANRIRENSALYGGGQANRFQPTRREVMRIGSLAGIGLTLPDYLVGRAAANPASPQRTAKSCILVWLDGGPSHIDTWDPKPDAAREVRGPFAAIPTAIPGIQVSELFPQLAARLNQVCLIRSVTSPLGEHNLGAQYMMTGYQPSPVIEYPPWISVVTDRLGREATGAMPGSLPRSVAIPDFRIGGGKISGHGFLSPEVAPFSVDGDPAAGDFRVRHLAAQGALTDDRLGRRAQFRNFLGGEAGGDPLTEQAFSLLASEQAVRAFEVHREPDHVRRRYGGKTIGQSCLLARRLVESGVPLVSIVHHGWDTHQDLVTRLRDGYTGATVPVGLGPSLDMALGSLIDDLIDRNLYDETCIVVMGEFGRTPKWNPAGGRDHWPRVFSVLLAGGPFARGVVHGSSDWQGESPRTHAVTPADLANTIYHALGIDPAAMMETPDGRPIRLTDRRGAVISQVLA